MHENDRPQSRRQYAPASRVRIEIPSREVADFCRRNHIRKLALFGSVLMDDFRPDSDIDVLVEFEDGHVPGFMGLAGMEIELSKLLQGRKVDLNTLPGISPYYRDDVLEEAEVLSDQT